MQIFPVGKIYDFMGARRLFAAISIIITIIAAVAVFITPRPSFGTDFRAGTEVVRVEGVGGQNRFMIRVHEVSTLSVAVQDAIARALCVGEGLSDADCPEG